MKAAPTNENKAMVFYLMIKESLIYPAYP